MNSSTTNPIRKSSKRTERTWLGQRGWDQEHRLDSKSAGLRISVLAWLEDGKQGDKGEVVITRIYGDFWRGRDKAMQYGGVVLYNPADEEIEEAVNALAREDSKLGMNAEQATAVRESRANYRASDKERLLAWRVLHPSQFPNEGFETPKGAVFVEFTYEHLGDPDRPHGREVTIFDTDGKVLDSQDFG